jgi:hypothetical protein
MCTALLSVDPTDPFPVLLVGVRDEFHDRASVPPGRHWPDRPGLVGGQDLLAGGTWLAVDPTVPRAGCVLNGKGRPAPEDGRLSRGELPLRFAAEGGLGELDAARYDPFHLVCADLDRVRLISWDGEALTDRALEPGLHIVTNLGPAGAEPLDGFDRGAINARIAHFRPRLAAARRPSPGAGSTRAAWGEWLPLVEGDGLDPRDPRALVVRGDYRGRAAGTVSVTLLALGRDGVRYDFNGSPTAHGPWSTIMP